MHRYDIIGTELVNKFVMANGIYRGVRWVALLERGNRVHLPLMQLCFPYASVMIGVLEGVILMRCY